MASTNSPRMVIAANVRAEMARKRLTQSQVALSLGMSQSALARRLSGDAPFDADHIVALSEFLNVAADALLFAEVAA